MSQNNKAMERLGASTLVAATVVAGLSFGPAAANAAPVEHATSRAVSTQAVASPVVTKAIIYTNAAGTRLMEVRGTAPVGSKLGYYLQGAAVGAATTAVAADGSFVITTAAAAATATNAFQLYAQVGSEKSTIVSVPLSATKAQLPDVEFTSGSYYTNAAGKKYYKFTLKGLPGATVRWAPPGLAWSDDASSPKFDSNGNVTIPVTSYVGPDSVNFNQVLNGQTGTAITTPLAGLKNELPTVEFVDGSYTLGIDGKKSYTFHLKGLPGATVRWAPPGLAWSDDASSPKFDNNGNVTITGTGYVGPDSVNFNHVLNGQTGTAITVPLSKMQNASPAYEAVTLSSPTSGSTYEPNSSVTFTGRGTPGGQITVTPGHGITPVTTTVGANGTWSVAVTLGTDEYSVTVAQRAQGQSSTVDNVKLAPNAVNKPWAVSTPTSGSTANGPVTFSGTGRPGETVTVHNTTFASADVTTTVDAQGNWSVSRYVGTGYYSFDVTQTNATGAVTGQTKGIEINKRTAVNLPWAVTAPTNGSDHKGEMVAFTGTGRAGETVTVKNTTFASADVTTTVGNDGHWTISRWIGTGYYSFDVTQTNAAGTVTGTTTGIEINKITGPINKPFAVTKAPTGDVATGGYVFEGTGKAGAIVTLDPSKTTGQLPVTTIVDDEGNWSVNKFIGTSRYDFQVSMTKDGNTESLANIVVTGK